MLFESELGVESISKTFHLRIDFSVSPYSSRLDSVFLASMDLENMITLVFFGIQFDSQFGTPHCQV